MVKREDVQAVIDGILSGKILEAFESYYHDDVVMSENGAQERVGKDANREYEEQFVNNVECMPCQAASPAPAPCSSLGFLRRTNSTT